MMNQEKHKPVLSIITPVYKAEAYLNDCLDSILCQNFTDFELILVDDGSPDKSGEICDTYAAKDHRIRVIHKANGGASSARNTGVDAVCGRYVGWVDSDDRVAPEMFQTLISLIEEYDADIAECQYYEVKGDVSLKSGQDEPVVFGSGNFMMKEFFEAHMKPSLWAKVYKSEIWEGISFPLGRNHQDFYVNIRFALKPLKYVRISDAMYYYIIRSNSITTTRTSRELRETIYKYEYTMKLARDADSGGPAKKYLTDDAINRLMSRYFDVSAKSNLKNQNLYNYIIRKKLGLSFVKYIFLKELPFKTRISYALLLSNMKNIQQFFHRLIGKNS